MISPIQRQLIFSNICAQEQSIFLTQLSRLPQELFLDIMMRVAEANLKQLVSSRQTSKKFCLLVEYPCLWNAIYDRSFPLYPKPLPMKFFPAYSAIIRNQSNVRNGVYKSTHFEFPTSSYICAQAVSKEMLITADYDKTIRIHSLKTGKCLKSFQDDSFSRIQGIWVTKEKFFAFYLDQTVKSWEMGTWKLLDTTIGTQPCSQLIVSDGKWISSFEDGTIEVRDIETRELLHALKEHKAKTCFLTASGGKLGSGSIDKIFKIWDLKTGNCLLTGDMRDCDPFHLVYLCEHTFFTVFRHGSLVTGWDIATGNRLVNFMGDGGEVKSLAVMGDNLISYSGWKGNVRIWDIEAKSCLKSFYPHMSNISCMNVIDGRLILRDCAIPVLWDFLVEDNDVLEDIARMLRMGSSDSIELNEEAISEALDLFSRMPNKIKNLILSPEQRAISDLNVFAEVLATAIEDYLKVYNAPTEEILQNDQWQDGMGPSKKQKTNPALMQ